MSKSSIFVDSFFKKIYNEIKYCSANGWYFKIKKIRISTSLPSAKQKEISLPSVTLELLNSSSSKTYDGRPTY